MTECSTVQILTHITNHMAKTFPRYHWRTLLQINESKTIQCHLRGEVASFYALEFRSRVFS